VIALDEGMMQFKLDWCRGGPPRPRKRHSDRVWGSKFAPICFHIVMAGLVPAMTE
jgi:hypothetical protein